MAFNEKHSSTASDVERPHSGSTLAGEEIKRDLKSRHINMIAIAGMIVSSDSIDGDRHAEPRRERACF